MQTRPSRALVLVSALAATTVACSFVLTRTEGQCNTHADCAARGGDFVNSVCTDSHVCVPLAVDAATPTSSGLCAKNSECVGSFANAVCRNQQCQPLTPLDIAGVRCASNGLGQTKDGALLIGMLADLDHAGTQDDPADLARSAGLAITDLDSVGSSGTVTGLPPIVGVVCDEFSASSIDYLLDKLQARVVLGPTHSQNLANVLQKTRAAGAVLVSTRADDPNADAKSTDGSFFSFRPNRARQLTYFQNAVQKTLAIAGLSSSAKVVLAVGSDASTKTFADRLPSLDGGAAFIRIDYSAVGESGFQPGYQNTLVAPLVSAKPELVVAASAVDPWDVIVANIEKSWDKNTPRPYYLLQDKNSVLERQVAAIEQDCGGCGVAKRIIGIAPLHDAAVYKSFVDDYRAARNAAPVFGAELAYDALYGSVYALLRGASASHLDVNAVSGAAFRDGLAAITGPTGSPKRVGAADAADIVRAIATDKLALVGASGPLVFDGNNAPTADGRLYCMANGRFCDSGVAFSAATGNEYSVAPDPECKCF